jgi:aspergillopepsin I
MPSLYQIVVASTLLGLGAAAPVQKRAQPFTIQQVANPKHVKNGVAAYVKALSKWGAPAAQIKTILDASSSSVTTTPQQYDSEYLTPVTIGDQDFTLDFDTGSSDL